MSRLIVTSGLMERDKMLRVTMSVAREEAIWSERLTGFAGDLATYGNQNYQQGCFVKSFSMTRSKMDGNRHRANAPPGPARATELSGVHR